MHKYYKYFAALLISAIFMPCISTANPSGIRAPSTIHYYARLKDADGKPLNGKVAVKAFLYDSAAEGMSGDLNDSHVLYAENYGDVNVTKGNLNLTLGGGEAVGPFTGSSLPIRKIAEAKGLYLELYIEEERLSPRQWIGFENSSYGAAYATRAGNLAGPLTITTASFPTDLPASKLNCTGGRTITKERLPAIASSKITVGELLPARLPTGIPLSKLDPTGGPLSPDRLPNVSAVRIQSGQFGVERLPAGIVAPSELTTTTGFVDGTGSTGSSGDNCHCMAAVHSTTGGGAEGMNDVNITMNPSGGAVTCDMTFSEMAPPMKRSSPECAPYPDALGQCTTYCHTSCEETCPNPPWHPICTFDELRQCENLCFLSCNRCYTSPGALTMPCRASYMCVCAN